VALGDSLGRITRIPAPQRMAVSAQRSDLHVLSVRRDTADRSEKP